MQGHKMNDKSEAGGDTAFSAPSERQTQGSRAIGRMWLNQKTAYKILKIGGGFHFFGWCFGSYCYLFGNQKGSDFQAQEINQSLFFKKVKNY